MGFVKAPQSSSLLRSPRGNAVANAIESPNVETLEAKKFMGGTEKPIRKHRIWKPKTRYQTRPVPDPDRVKSRTRQTQSEAKPSPTAYLPGLADLDTRKSRNLSSEDGSVVLKEIHSSSEAHCQLLRSETNESKDRRTKPQHSSTSFAHRLGGVKLPAGSRCVAFVILLKCSAFLEKRFPRENHPRESFELARLLTFCGACEVHGRFRSKGRRRFPCGR